MSISLNTNQSALLAIDNLDTVSQNLQTNVQSLSSGLKINSPSDDPSGMIEAQELGFQLAGIGQAMTNTQDAMNLAKTAGSGLQQIAAVLQQIRTLTEAAANNATSSPTQLAAQQSQIASAISSIDDIANNTEWGNLQLLNGTAGVDATVSDTGDVVGMFVGSTIGGMAPAAGPITLTLTQSASQTTLTTNQPFTGLNAIVPAGSFSINGTSFSADGVTQTVQDVINEINDQSNTTGVVASAVPNGAGVSVQLQAANYGSNFPVTLYDPNNLFDTSSTPLAVAGTNAAASVTVPVQSVNGPTTTTVNFTGGLGPTGSGLELTDSTGNIVTLTAAGNMSGTLAAGADIGSISTGTVHFQMGQGAGQAVSYVLPDAQASQLGSGIAVNQNLSTIDVTTESGAQTALSIVDAAIDQLGTMQGSLGAFQSGLLTPNQSVLTTANQNLTSTRSGIEDTNVASEMTDYTQNQVIQQSALAVLAQANLDPQKVLQLLQSSNGSGG